MNTRFSQFDEIKIGLFSVIRVVHYTYRSILKHCKKFYIGPKNTVVLEYENYFECFNSWMKN
jgi:hypothetical protein